MSESIAVSEVNSVKPTLREAVAVWFRIGILSFGGPAAQIALMHRMVVDEKSWLSEKQYLNALSFCMLLPGPEAMQLATYAGWRLHGVVGGLLAGLLFVLPGAFVIGVLAAIYSLYGQVPLVSALFLGVKAAVLIVVIEALLRVSSRALKGLEHYLMAGLAFAGLFFFDMSYPLIVLIAGLYGFARGAGGENSSAVSLKLISSRSTTKTVILGLLAWWVPIAILHMSSAAAVFSDLALFFSKLAVVTFGGAYAVLAYMAQDGVGQYGWITAGEMMDGLGLAETTPGPLILVTEFVGFLAAFRSGGIGFGIMGAIVTLWVTFVPCFLWIFAGAPYIEWLGAQPRLKSALSMITAAVVGVILNLSVWFALHVLFTEVQAREFGILKLWQPALATIDFKVAFIALASGFLMLKLHWSIARVLLLAAIAGVVLSYVFK